MFKNMNIASNKAKLIVWGIVLIVILCCLVGFLLIYFLPVNTQKVKFIAHRGLSSQFYENTTDAFEGAGRSDFFYGIETDIQVTSDGNFVCAHDNNPFNDAAIKIDEITLSEARLLPLRNPDYRIATFEEYLDICASFKKAPIIEIKPTLDEQTLIRLVEIVKDKNIFDESIFISFSRDNIVLIKELFPDAKVQLLLSDVENFDYKYDLSVSHSALNRSHIKQAHDNGLDVGVWTINQRLSVRWFIMLGVDYITTNYDLS